jgi:HTH-type transcriptional regulator/antitoxin HigA
MDRIDNEDQYRSALKRVEELLPYVNDDTPVEDARSRELEMLSEMVSKYSDEHFAIDKEGSL